MLNAFRHHRGRHKRVPRHSSGARCWCSTPFGITEVGTRTALAAGSRAARVLNAFRHHRGRHGWRRFDQFRATRECSTPFGITEVGTESAATAASPSPVVLNAFRHHRGRHVSDRRLTLRSLGQVLNAFRHHRGRHSAVVESLKRRRSGCSTPFGITEVGTPAGLAGGFGASGCSTPFGITEVGTTATQSRVDDDRTVLNAFRHHRGRHPATDQPPDVARRDVLNAFRHHRGRHIERRLATRVRREVLNAFRHHRGRHLSHPMSSHWHVARCSTPFGITEVGT